MSIPTESKVLYEALSQVLEDYKIPIINSYDRIYDIPEAEKVKDYEYKLSDYLDLAACIAFEVEHES